VILPSSALPQKYRWLLLFNPMSGIIEGYRSALFGLPFDWTAIGVASLITVLLLFYSAYSFSRVEKSFADII
jgi:lipopolysaccharide transport system permease protein